MVENEPHECRPRTSITGENSDRVNALIRETRRIRLSAHERFFAAAAEYFLVVLTDSERNATFSHFPHYPSVCAVWILSSWLLCALLC